MGPTGAPTEIPRRRERAARSAAASATPCCSRSRRRCATRGNRVIYFAGYKKGEDLFKREEIEAATDQVIWSTDTGAEIAPGRPQDAHFRGNIVQAMVAYATGELGDAAGAAVDGRPHHRDRLGSHDGGGQGARGTACWQPYLKHEPRRHRAASTRRCSA